MSKKEKTLEILKGREILRVDSLQRTVPKKNLSERMVIATVFFIVVMVYFYWINRGPLDLLLIWWGITIMLYVTVVWITVYFSSKLGKPLIITEMGIAGPNLAELWHDIESYRWESFEGAKKILGPTVLSACGGICLKIKNKGIFPRTIDGYGHSMLAQYLIFFSPEQIALAEHIFDQKGIKKSS